MCVTSFEFSRSFRSSVFFCSTHYSWQSHPSVFSVYWPAARRSASIFRLVRSIFRFSTASFAAGARDENYVRWTFPSFLFNGTVTYMKLETKRGNTLQTLRKNLSDVWVVGGSSSSTATVIDLDSFTCPGRIPKSRQLMFLAKKEDFFNMTLTVQSWSRVNNYCICAFWSSTFFEKTAISLRYAWDHYNFTDNNTQTIARWPVTGTFSKLEAVYTN